MPVDDKGATNGWNEWSRFVLKELERLDDDIKCLSRKMDTMHDDIISLKTKVALIGTVAGAIVSIVVSVVVKFVR
jgi:hypothetical protein